MSAKRRIPAWLITGVAGTVVAFLLCLTTWHGHNGFRDFVFAFGACGFPLAALATFVVFLAKEGKGSRRMCGFCGYDRVGLAVEAPCPECGKAGNATGAPLHKAVGHRPLPVWLWGPIVLAIPGAVFVGYTFRRGDAVAAVLGVIPLAFIGAIVWAWRRGRQSM